jgi:hypothetical protein
MAQPTQDFLQFLRSLWRLARWIALGMAALLVVILASEIHSLYLLAAALSPWAGRLFLLITAAGLWWLLGVPILRFCRMPLAVKPPPLPGPGEGLAREHLIRHLDYVAKYLRAQRANPLMAERSTEVVDAIGAAHALRDRIAARTEGEPEKWLGEIESFERDRVDPLLRPLDAEAERVIRNEALGVGVATAISFNGTMDAFIVLWRNINMVSRVARIYHGRPGPRAGLAIYRDVAATALLSNYLDNITDQVGGFLGNWAGGVAGVVAGPLLDGGANALMTLRLGYLAKARCRSFQAWTDAHRRSVLMKCLKLAKDASVSVLSEIAAQTGGVLGGVVGGAAAAGSTLVKGAKETIRGAKDLFTGKWPGKPPEEGEEPAT